jgi:hypothetical protein
MTTVWVLTIAYVLGSGTATENYGPYDTLDLCKKAASETVVLKNDSWVTPVKPMACVPEYRTDK